MNKGEWAIQCGKHIEPTSATSHPGNFNKKYHYHDKNEYECVYCEYNSLKEKLSQYESDNKKLRECVEFYGDLSKWETEDSFSEEYTMFCANWNNDFENVNGLLYGGKKARECLKGIDGE